MFSQVDYKIPRGQPMYVISTPNEQEQTKFSVKEVLNAYTNVNGLTELTQPAIDKVIHYLLDKEDEYSTYIRLKEKFEGDPVEQSEPEQEYEREWAGYHYSDGTAIRFGDEIEYEQPRQFLRAPFSTPPSNIIGEIVKHFTGPSYDFRVDISGTPSMKSPTLASIVNSGVQIKKVN
jgi:hypothetical protein